MHLHIPIDHSFSRVQFCSHLLATGSTGLFDLLQGDFSVAEFGTNLSAEKPIQIEHMDLSYIGRGVSKMSLKKQRCPMRN